LWSIKKECRLRADSRPKLQANAQSSDRRPGLQNDVMFNIQNIMQRCTNKTPCEFPHKICVPTHGEDMHRHPDRPRAYVLYPYRQMYKYTCVYVNIYEYKHICIYICMRGRKYTSKYRLFWKEYT